MEISPIVIATLLGTLLGGLLFTIPGIGVTAVFGIFLAQFGTTPWILSDPDLVFVFFMSLTVSGAFASIIPAFFFSAPGPSTIFLTGSGEKYRRQGRSLLGALTAGRGCLTGVLLLAALAPFFLYLFEPLQGFIGKHLRWPAAVLVIYMLGGEFFFHCRRAARSRRRGEYRALWLAPLIFLLTGLFGVLSSRYRQLPLVAGEGSFYAVAVGLFLLPPLIRRSLRPGGAARKQESGEELPRENGAGAGTVAGGIGGLLALFLPGIWAGPGALVAGHLLPRKKEKAFLFSQGMVQSFAAVGAFLFFFLPQRGYIRSAAGRVLSPYFHANRQLSSFLLIVAVVLVSGGLSYLVFHLTARLARAISRGVAPRALAVAIILFVLGVTCFRYGPVQLPVLFTGACLGSLPLIFGCRRSNSFAVTLVPFLLFLLGWHPAVFSFLGFR